jgi:hypothetical protein
MCGFKALKQTMMCMWLYVSGTLITGRLRDIGKPRDYLTQTTPVRGIHSYVKVSLKQRNLGGSIQLAAYLLQKARAMGRRLAGTDTLSDTTILPLVRVV